MTIIKIGGDYVVQSVQGDDGGTRTSCDWSVTFVPTLEAPALDPLLGPPPHPGAGAAMLLCNGEFVRLIWISPSDVVDVDAAVLVEAERYVEDVLVPSMSIGANPARTGLAGLRSWFWVEGFDGQVTAPPITAFGMAIDVRLTAGTVRWDYGDGTVEPGDLGRAYPAESTVQHAHRSAGRYRIEATVELVAEYRVDGGPWLALPSLTAQAATDHPVEAREAVITET